MSTPTPIAPSECCYSFHRERLWGLRPSELSRSISLKKAFRSDGFVMRPALSLSRPLDPFLSGIAVHSGNDIQQLFDLRPAKEAFNATRIEIAERGFVKPLGCDGAMLSEVVDNQIDELDLAGSERLPQRNHAKAALAASRSSPTRDRMNKPRPCCSRCPGAATVRPRRARVSSPTPQGPPLKDMRRRPKRKKPNRFFFNGSQKISS